VKKFSGGVFGAPGAGAPRLGGWGGGGGGAWLPQFGQCSMLIAKQSFSEDKLVPKLRRN